MRHNYPIVAVIVVVAAAYDAVAAAAAAAATIALLQMWRVAESGAPAITYCDYCTTLPAHYRLIVKVISTLSFSCVLLPFSGAMRECGQSREGARKKEKKKDDFYHQTLPPIKHTHTFTAGNNYLHERISRVTRQ